MTSHNEDKGHWHGDIHDGKMHFDLPDATSTSHNEAQKTNEEIVEETFDEYVNYWSGSPKGKTHRVGLTKQELAFVLTLKDEAHRKELEEAVKAERERVREIVEFERVYFWGTPELETQTKINNMVVDNILETLTPTKEVTEELPTNH